MHRDGVRGGRTLDEWIREGGALPPVKALEILADICDAVSYMHSKGTIHRDIKTGTRPPARRLAARL